MIEKLKDVKDFSRFLIKKEDLKFDVEEFIEELSKSKRKKKRTRKLEEYKKILMIDLINFQ